MWPKTTLLLLMWPRDAKSLDTPETEEGKRERRERNISAIEKHQLAASHMCQDWGWAPRLGISIWKGVVHTCSWTKDRTRHLGLCPDWELNPQPFCFWLALQPSHTNQGQVISYICPTEYKSYQYNFYK